MAKPKHASIATTNLASLKTVVATSGATAIEGSPASNLTTPERQRRWVVPWADTTASTARAVIDMETAMSPEIFSLIDCNATSGRVRIYGADDSGLTTNVIYYDFDLYDAAASGVHTFYPQADSTEDTKDGVRWASDFMVDNYSLVTQGLANDDLTYVYVDGSPRTYVWQGGQSSSTNDHGHQARVCGTSYYGGEPAKKPSDIGLSIEPVTSLYNVELPSAYSLWGNATDLGAEEQESMLHMRMAPGTLADREKSVTAAYGWVQEGTTDIWSQNLGYTSTHFSNQQIYYGGTRIVYQNSTATPGINKFSQVQQADNTYTIYINISASAGDQTNPNGVVDFYPSYSPKTALPIYYHANRDAQVPAGSFRYFELDSRTANAAASVGRGCAAAVGNEYYVATFGVRLDSSSSGDYWTLAQWNSGTNGAGVYYLRDREVLRVHVGNDSAPSFFNEQGVRISPVGSIAASYVDIALTQSAIADNAWHAITVSVAQENRRVTVYVDGVAIGNAQFDASTTVSSANIYQLGGLTCPPGYMKTDGSTPYAPSTGFTYSNNGPSKIHLAFFSLGDRGYSYANAAAGATEAATARFALMAQAEAMYHLGLSTDTLKRRYWAIDFDGVTKLGTTSQLEVGSVWLGDKTDIVAQTDAQTAMMDPSVRTTSYGGSVYSDRMKVQRGIQFEVASLNQDETTALLEVLRTSLGGSMIVDLRVGATSASVRDMGSFYGKTEPSGIKASASSVFENKVQVEIKDDRR